MASLIETAVTLKFYLNSRTEINLKNRTLSIFIKLIFVQLNNSLVVDIFTIFQELQESFLSLHYCYEIKSGSLRGSIELTTIITI